MKEKVFIRVDKVELKKISPKIREKIKEDFWNMSFKELYAKYPSITKGTLWYIVKKVSELKRRKILSNFRDKLDSLTPFEIGYIIGIIEGEGYLGIIRIKEGNHIRYRPILSVTNRMKEIIAFFSKKVSLNVNIHTFSMRAKNRKRTYREYANWGYLYEWKTNDKKVLKILLSKLYPYFVGRKDEVECLLGILNLKNFQGKIARRYYDKLQIIKTRTSNHTSLAKSRKERK